MAKKKTERFTEKITAWLRRFWSIPLILVALVVYGIVQLYSYLTLKPFNDTYGQVERIYQSFDIADFVIRDSGSLSNKCNTNYYGFSSSIECGTYAALYLNPKKLDRVEMDISDTLIDNGFSNIKLSTDSSNDSEGKGSFNTNNGMICGLYWGPESKISSKPIVDFYCRKTAPYYLPGYEKE